MLNFFAEKVKRITENTKVNERVYNGKRKVFGDYSNEWIDEDLIMSIMSKLDLKRCYGYDRVPLIFLYHGREKLCKIITKLMKSIYNTGMIPEQWKVSRVIPILKKGNAKTVSNYRPISNLSSVTKIFERLVLHRISMIEDLEGIDLTGSHQHGFKKKRSTETACLEIQSEISTSCDENKYVLVSAIDLSAAFDVVNHSLLIKRLNIMGLPVKLVKIIEEWLLDRIFYCEVNGKVSVLLQVECGTVQGSILGPILFALFTSPLGDIIKVLISYADDNYLVTSSAKLDCCISTCQDNTSKMIEWLNDSGLMINTDKTEICIFHKSDTVCPLLTIGANVFQIKNQIKILGTVFDTKLQWNEHVHYAIRNANKSKQALCLIAKYFTTEEMVKLATAFFYSKLYYGSKVWLMSTLHSNLKNKLWQASSRMLQIVQKDYDKVLSFDDLHRLTNRASPNMWCNYVTACAMYDCVTNEVPQNILTKMTINSLNTSRRPGITFTRTNHIKIGFNCLGNRLQLVSTQLNIDWSIMSKQAFKKHCKNLFLSYM